MNDMQELVTVEQAERVIHVAAVALPLLGIALGGAIGAARRRLGRGLGLGLLCGAVGPAAWVLWLMYNGVIGIYGLDSVKGLLINVALFVGIGVLVGLAAGLVGRRLRHGAGNGGLHSSE
jgi:hypothetical protein